MNLPEKITSLLKELKISYEKAGKFSIDLNEDLWMTEWQKRTDMLNVAENINKELRPVFEEWTQCRANYNTKTQARVQESLDEMVSILKKLNSQSKILLEKLSEKKDETKEELINCQRYPRVAAAYSMFS